jgi:polar amino acid transport system substrate-binding protein
LGITAPIRLTAWENAYNMARLHPDVVLFSAERTPERETLFHWVGPVGSNSAILYGKAGTDLTLADLADVHQVAAGPGRAEGGRNLGDHPATLFSDRQ